MRPDKREEQQMREARDIFLESHCEQLDAIRASIASSNSDALQSAAQALVAREET